MHRPIVPALAIFARAVERIDDPYARLAAAHPIVLFLLGKQRVVGPRGANLVAQHGVRLLVASLPQRLAFATAPRASVAQHATRGGCAQLGQLFVASPHVTLS